MVWPASVPNTPLTISRLWCLIAELGVRPCRSGAPAALHRPIERTVVDETGQSEPRLFCPTETPPRPQLWTVIWAALSTFVDVALASTVVDNLNHRPQLWKTLTGIVIWACTKHYICTSASPFGILIVKWPDASAR